MIATTGSTGPAAGDTRNKRQKLLARKSALWNERSSWLAQWRDISDYVLPRAGRYFPDDQNRGAKRGTKIYDNTGVRALRVLAAGMMAGMTSPARPWFRLGLSDRDLMEKSDVKVWLNKCNLLMRDVFARSNTYLALHSGYEELGAFGTDADIILPDFDNVIHHYPLTVGQYAIAVNDKDRVDTLYREFVMTVGQMVRRFGRENCSASVQNQWDRGSVDQTVTILHAIEPRTERDTTKLDAKNMRFKSIYFEPSRDNTDKFLSESGFKRFPAIVSRWVATGGDVYGSSPGMDAIGDVKQLQHQQLRKSQGIDYQTNPPLQVPTSYKDAQRNRLPGGLMYVDVTGPGQGVRSAFEVNLNLEHLLVDIKDVRERIDAGFYADLFLMLSNMDKTGITATEVAERHEEKLLMLGPVLERLHGEKLSPMIDITFDYIVAAGILPPPPEALHGVDLNVEFISTLAQAQRAVAATSYDRLLGTVGQLAPIFPGVIDKINTDQVIDDYAEMYGVNPEIIVDDEQAQASRDARAQAQQAAQMAASVPQMAQTAKAVSGIDAPGLSDVMRNFTGYSTPATTAAA
jgi:hypothetical protein